MDFRISYVKRLIFVQKLYDEPVIVIPVAVHDDEPSGQAGEQDSTNDAFVMFNGIEIPDYSGSPSVVINNNMVFFDTDDFESAPMESYSDLDSLGRCGPAVAVVCFEIMPTEDRESIGQVKPSGWHTIRYDDLIETKYLYNRCHLIAYMLSGENANEKNLITGTRYMNVDGMLPYESMVCDFVKRNRCSHVAYRVTPVFVDNDLVASGVVIEAKSLDSDGLEFCVFCYNVQPGILINYADGTSERIDDEKSIEIVEHYILNTNSKKFHKPECESANKISSKNRAEYEGLRSELIKSGYEPCGVCNP